MLFRISNVLILKIYIIIKFSWFKNIQRILSMIITTVMTVFKRRLNLIIRTISFIFFQKLVLTLQSEILIFQFFDFDVKLSLTLMIYLKFNRSVLPLIFVLLYFSFVLFLLSMYRPLLSAAKFLALIWLNLILRSDFQSYLIYNC